MKKIQNDLPKVWVVTGVPEFETEPRILAICPDRENALKARVHYYEDYDDIECEEFSQETYEDTPMFYAGDFSIELRPFGIEPETYIFGSLNYFNSRELCVPENGTPEQHDYFGFSIQKTIADTNKVTMKIYGNFESPTQLPFYSEDVPSVERARREWLMEKINAKGLIKVVMPDFEI